jgi:uncharacterized protein (DUF885 family)
MRFRLLVAGVLIVVAGCSWRPGTTAVPAANSDFARFADEYFQAAFEWSPSSGTAAGFHQFDGQAENLSAADYAKRIQTLTRLQTRLDQFPLESLSPDDMIDSAMIGSAIQAELLDIQRLQTWKKNPMRYVGLPGNAADVLMKRDFAPAAERLKSVTARLKAVPLQLQAMRENVSGPPREFTDLAIRVAEGSAGFLGDNVAAWAKTAAAGDAEAWKAFNDADGAAVQAMKDAAAWLRKDLLPRSKGSYAIGADAFSRKLMLEDQVDIPLARLLEIGQANLDKDYRDFVDTARKIDPKLSPAEVMKSLENDHPAEADLIPSARRTIEGVRQFLIDKKICSIPSEVRPTVTETPPYDRVGSFASMDTPGAFETKATEAFYYVTPPEKDWDANHKEEHLRAYNASVMPLITIHEAYPGHYLQFLWAKQFPTKTRKLLMSAANEEGWAHYTEQMMLEQGYGNGDPKVRLAQLEEALLRDCRYVNGIMLHTKGWSVEQGKALFVEKGFQEPANAYEEARRGAYNPTYLYYTLGKLMIYKLRGDVEKARGSSFSLQQFHDDFVRQGALPLRIMRRILLPGDKAPLL